MRLIRPLIHSRVVAFDFKTHFSQLPFDLSAHFNCPSVRESLLHFAHVPPSHWKFKLYLCVEALIVNLKWLQRFDTGVDLFIGQWVRIDNFEAGSESWLDRFHVIWASTGGFDEAGSGSQCAELVVEQDLVGRRWSHSAILSPVPSSIKKFSC